MGAFRRYPGLSYDASIDGGSVEVRISAPLDLPLPLPGGPEEATIAATGSAAVQLSS